MKSLLLVACLALSAFAQESGRVRYDGYKVLRTEKLTKTNVELLQNLQKEQDLDFWQDPIVSRSADIMVSPEGLPAFEAFLKAHGIQFSVMIEDFEALYQSNRLVLFLDSKLVNLYFFWGILLPI